MYRPDTPPPSLFVGLTETDRTDFMARAAIREFPAQTLLYRQGEPAESLFLIRTGRVALTCTSTTRRHVVLRLIGPDDCLGIASLPAGSFEIATALTLEPTAVLAWNASICRSAAVYPMLVHNALRMALQYLKECGDRHVALLSHTAEQRLAHTLARLGATTGRVVPTGVEVEISNNDLAALSDVGMFTTSRQLKQWERDGHVVKRRQHVLIRDLDALLPESRAAASGGRRPSTRGPRTKKR
jgi:CRP/FNR family transcriptional regulator, cyclic AMP receptor protein